MKVTVAGRDITLNQNDFIASGGEGSIYEKNGSAFKIYTDPSKMIASQKIQELAAITEPKVIKPTNIVYDSHGKAIGYTMRYLTNTNAICQLFVKGFKDRNGVDHSRVIELAKDMAATYRHIHSKNILVVDGNEMNFLTDDRFKEVYFIDVDSYQTPSYPATALMESIRDRHCNNHFNQNTDWFAWGIVTFQMLIGIHPYKGKHKQYTDLDARMVNNISVFNKGVGLPPVCQPFTVIPPALRDWYKAVFEEGKRIAPPADFASVIVVNAVVNKIVGNDKFEIKLLDTLNSPIVRMLNVNGNRIAITKDMVAAFGCEIHPFYSFKTNTVYHVGLQNNALKFESNLSGDIYAEQIMDYKGNVYFKSGNKIFRLDVTKLPVKTIVTPVHVANVHENATKLYPGIAVQNMFDTLHVVVFPTPDTSREVIIKEIKGKIVFAKYDSKVAMFMCVDKNGKYNRYVLRFNEDHSEYDVKAYTDVQLGDLNFIVLEHGIVCFINEQDELELFVNKKDDPLAKVIVDPVISSDMKLCANGKQTLFSRDNEIYSLKMK